LAVEATYGLSKSAIVRLLIVGVCAAYIIIKFIIKIRPSLSVSIYKAYTYIALYILIAYAIIL
jgi:hypothetical protein